MFLVDFDTSCSIIDLLIKLILNYYTTIFFSYKIDQNPGGFFIKVRNRRILSRVCYANIQPINQSLTSVLALYQRRTDNGREAGSARQWNVDATLRPFAWYMTRTEKGK